MSTYMKTNALNTAFQLLKVIASGKLLQEQITEAETEMHALHSPQRSRSKRHLLQLGTVYSS